MVEFGADAYAHRKQVGVKQLYNQVPQTAWVSWSPRQADFSSGCCHSSSSSRSWGQDAVVRASARQRAWDLRTPVKQPSRMRKKCCYIQRNGSQYVAVCSVTNLPLTHNQHQPFRNPFENKVWEVYFSKEVCSFDIIVDYVSECICILIVVSFLNNKSNGNKKRYSTFHKAPGLVPYHPM